MVWVGYALVSEFCFLFLFFTNLASCLVLRLEKTLMLGKMDGKRRGQQGMS